MNKHATLKTMTRFEYIAIKAMQAMIANGQYEDTTIATIADLAIGLAEGMDDALELYILLEDE